MVTDLMERGVLRCRLAIQRTVNHPPPLTKSHRAEGIERQTAPMRDAAERPQAGRNRPGRASEPRPLVRQHVALS